MYTLCDHGLEAVMVGAFYLPTPTSFLIFLLDVFIVDASRTDEGSCFRSLNWFAKIKINITCKYSICFAVCRVSIGDLSIHDHMMQAEIIGCNQYFLF